MYTRHSEIKMGQVVALPPERKGETVQLLGQGGDHKVTYCEAGKEPVSVPSHEFFGLFRQASPTEIAAFQAAASPQRAPKEPAATKDAPKEPAPAK